VDHVIHPQWPDLSLSFFFFFFFFVRWKVARGGWWVAASRQVILYLVAYWVSGSYFMFLHFS
jgi:hypothetical protein